MLSLYDSYVYSQYRIKALKAENDAFKSGEKYLRMQEQHRKDIALYERKLAEARKEIANSHKETVTVRNIWMDIVEELDVLHEKDTATIKAQAETIRNQKAELYAVLVALEEEKEKNRKLQAQLNRDYSNSSKPSSMSPNHNKITNNREKTDRKPGGQPGHKGYGRKRRTPDRVITIPPTEELLNENKYRPTGETVRKQVVSLRISVETTEYETTEYIEIATGKKVHAPFPEGVVDDVNYDGSISAFAFLLNNECNVSIDKVRRFLADLTDGDLTVSKGMINGLSKKFSCKTETERKEMFNRLLASPVMHTDATNARMNGSSRQVFVCADPASENTLFFAREHKGHKGIENTPVELYSGTLVHDHDKTFYNYGSDHQECLEHILRYLLDSIQNEPDLLWNKQMRSLVQEMIHYRNGIPLDASPDEADVAAYEKRYDEILNLAQNEYEDVPPSDYYPDGYNLFLRLREYRHNHLLFLHNMDVPSTNNLSERLLRGYKRKQKQVMTFRSDESLQYLCDCLGMLTSLRHKDVNMYHEVSDIFNRFLPALT